MCIRDRFYSARQVVGPGGIRPPGFLKTIGSVHGQANYILMGKPVVHFEIASTGSDEAQKFYSSLFGWKIDANNPMKYGTIKTAEGVGINGGIYQTDDGRSSTLVYVAVEDTDAYLKKVQALGGSIVKPTEVVPGMVTFALFADPTGTVMGLVKDEMPPKVKAKAATAKASARPSAASAKRTGAKKSSKKKSGSAKKSRPAKKAAKKKSRK